MSVQATIWAWNQNIQNATDKITLLAVADYATPEGVAWPKIATISRMVGKSERTIKRSIAKLCGAGFLSRTQRFDKIGGNIASEYQLSMEEQNGEKKEENGAEGGDTDDMGRVSPVSPPGVSHVSPLINISAVKEEPITPNTLSNPRTKFAESTEREPKQEAQQDDFFPVEGLDLSLIAPNAKPTGRKISPQEVSEVFSDWQTILNHPLSALCDKRAKLITQALEWGYSREAIRWAFIGNSRSSHHQGINDRNTKYHDLGLILRDTANIERFIDYRLNPPKPKKFKDDWRRDELANKFYREAVAAAVADSDREEAQRAAQVTPGQVIDGNTGEVIDTGAWAK